MTVKYINSPITLNEVLSTITTMVTEMLGDSSVPTSYVSCMK